MKKRTKNKISKRIARTVFVELTKELKVQKDLFSRLKQNKNLLYIYFEDYAYYYSTAFQIRYIHNFCNKHCLDIIDRTENYFYILFNRLLAY